MSTAAERAATALRAVDELLNCFICKETFTAPVTFKQCQHTFCSRCIREWLARNGDCPTCRTKCAQGDLVINSALSGVARRFGQDRDAILAVAAGAGAGAAGADDGARRRKRRLWLRRPKKAEERRQPRRGGVPAPTVV